MSKVRREKKRAAGYTSGRILQFVIDFHRRRGWGPSYREIAGEVKVNQSSVCFHVKHLIGRGLLEAGFIEGSDRVIARSLRPPDVAKDRAA